MDRTAGFAAGSWKVRQTPKFKHCIISKRLTKVKLKLRPT